MSRTPNEIMTDLLAAAREEDAAGVERASAELGKLPDAAGRSADDARRTRDETPGARQR